MRLSHLFFSLSAALTLGTGLSAQAAVINFQALADDTTSGASTPHGESAYGVMSITVDGVTVNIVGKKTGVTAPVYAYLDAGTAGLGVCSTGLISGASLGPRNSASNVCGNSSDDNVTVGEFLEITFNEKIENLHLWFNSNHDGDPIQSSGDNIAITIGGGPTAITPFAGNANCCDLMQPNNSIASIDANTVLRLSVANHQFYLSGLTFDRTSIPTPAVSALLGLGLLGFAVRRGRRAA
jgi:hypothetical protein